MTEDSVKARAKRLRSAVQSMFNVDVSVSQSYELLAKEENFPNWDAACKSLSAKRNGPIQPVSPAPGISPSITDKLSIAQKLSAFKGTVIFTGTSLADNANAMRDVVNNRVRKSGEHVLHVGLIEPDYPEGTPVVHLSSMADLKIDRAFSKHPQSVFVIDEVRNTHDLDLLINLGDMGFSIYSTMLYSPLTIEWFKTRSRDGSKLVKIEQSDQGNCNFQLV
jgi:hypothetical protein